MAIPPKSIVYVIVGLGNPGSTYIHTRHNLGRDALTALCGQLGWVLKRDMRLPLWAGKGEWQGVQIHVVIPDSYMNLSGAPVHSYLKREGFSHDALIVLVDDLDLPFGEIEYRQSGGTRGHKGLKSIQQAIGTQDYKRIRMGIGRPSEGIDVADYVLSRFRADEQEKVNEMVAKAIECVYRILTLPSI